MDKDHILEREEVRDKEIDFIATRDEVKIYYQVTDEMTAKTTREHELAPLKAVRDNYEKVVIAMNTNSTATVEGIIRVMQGAAEKTTALTACRSRRMPCTTSAAGSRRIC